MKNRFGKKWVLLLSVLAVVTGGVACKELKWGDKTGPDAELPRGAKGAISFNGAGKGVKVLNAGGKFIPASNIDLRGAKKLKELKITTYKKNPCVIEWCSSSGVCKVYIYAQLETCPDWW